MSNLSKINIKEAQRLPKNNIAKTREKAGLSQAQLCQRAGIPRGVLSMMESGRYYGPLPQAQELARALSVPLERLYPPEILSAIYGIGPGAEAKQRKKRATVTVRIDALLAAELDELAEKDGFGSRDATNATLVRMGLMTYRRYRAARTQREAEAEETKTILKGAAGHETRITVHRITDPVDLGGGPADPAPGAGRGGG